MPSRDPSELYKDKIEVSLDGRQIFYLFFGGAVIVGLVFVLGVMVGRRIEARGHVDRARTPSVADPLAALDRLEGSSGLAFRSTLTGGEATTGVERAIDELEKARKKSDGKKVEGKSADGKSVDAKAENGKAAAKSLDGKGSDGADAKGAVAKSLDGKSGDGKTGDGKSGDGKTGDGKGPDAKAVAAKSLDGKNPDAKGGEAKQLDGKGPDAKGGEAKQLDAKSPDAKGGEAKQLDGKSPDAKPAGKSADASRDDRHADGKPDKRADGDGDKKKRDGEGDPPKARFTLQLSSFQDKLEAEAFLATVKAAGYQPYLTEAEVSGKGTFYRVRLGSYRSLDAANEAKAELERTARKIATVMRL